MPTETPSTSRRRESALKRSQTLRPGADLCPLPFPASSRARRLTQDSVGSCPGSLEALDEKLRRPRLRRTFRWPSISALISRPRHAARSRPTTPTTTRRRGYASIRTGGTPASYAGTAPPRRARASPARGARRPTAPILAWEAAFLFKAGSERRRSDCIFDGMREGELGEGGAAPRHALGEQA